MELVGGLVHQALLGNGDAKPTVVETKEQLLRTEFVLRHSQGTLEGVVIRRPVEVPMPAVLVNVACYSSLADALEMAEAERYARRGYAYVLVKMSGTRAQVADHIFARFRADSEEVLDWLGVQCWCNGCVGCHGMSLLGNTAYSALAASCAPGAPSTRAKVCAVVAALSFTRITPTVFLWGQGIAVELALRFLWLAEVGCRPGELGSLELGLAMIKFFGPEEWPGLLDAVALRPISGADEAMWGRPNAIWQAGQSHRSADDPFWKDSRDVQCDLSALGPKSPAVHMVAGWWDIFIRQTLDDFVAISRCNPQDSMLTVYADGHFRVGMRHGEDILNLTLSLYDQHVKGKERHPDQQSKQKLHQVRKRVRLELVGAKEGEEWLECNTWPPPTLAYLDLFLQAVEPESTTLGTLLLEPPERSGHLQYLYDPADPTPYLGNGWLNLAKEGPRDQRDVEARSDILLLTSLPLKKTFDVVGNVTASICVSSSASECDFVVRLCVVRPPDALSDYLDPRGLWNDRLCLGSSINLCEGVIRASFCSVSRQRHSTTALSRRLSKATVVQRHSASASTGSEQRRSNIPVSAEGAQARARSVDVDLGPTACRFYEGDRIRLHICSAAHPRVLRHPLQADGEDWLLTAGSLGKPSLQVLFTGPKHASVLRLPLRGPGVQSPKANFI